ncbi:MAG: nucleoside deaminase [Melioribacteraceae bacterium]|nr:nucleoside deaminase [Melioribacteraceae bacterium]
MLFSEEHYKSMYAALDEAQKALDEDEIPVGAVVTCRNRIIGRGHNQVEKLKDPSAHAEMIAITAACGYLKSKFLDECDIYITVEPCVMCSGAILLSRIRNVYFAVFEPKFGASGSVYNILEEAKYNHKPSVYSGIYEKESQALLKSFFISQKEKTKSRSTQ